MNICGFNFENVVKHKNEFEIEIKYGQGYFSTNTNYFFAEEKKKKMLILLLFLFTYKANSRGANYYLMSDKLRELCKINTDDIFDKLIFDVYNISISQYGNNKDEYIDKVEKFINYLYMEKQIDDNDSYAEIGDYKIYYYDNKGQKQEIKLKSIDISYFL